MHTVITDYQRLKQLLKLLDVELDRAHPQNAAYGTSTAIDALLDGGFACYLFDLATAVSVARVPDTCALVVRIDYVGDLPNSTQALLDRFVEGDTLHFPDWKAD